MNKAATHVTYIHDSRRGNMCKRERYRLAMMHNIAYYVYTMAGSFPRYVHLPSPHVVYICHVRGRLCTFNLKGGGVPTT